MKHSPSCAATPRPRADLETARPRAAAAVSITIAAGFLAVSSLSAVETSAESWPHWRGPLANGKAALASPPVTWSETDHIKWKVPIAGFGTSTPIIWQDQVFVLTAIPTGKKVAPPAGEAPAAAATTADKPPVASATAPEKSAAPTPPPETGAGRQERRPDGDQPGGPQGRRRPRGPGGGMRSEKPTEAYQFVVLSLDRHSGKVRWQKTAREQLPHEGHHKDHGFASASPITDGEHLYVSFGSRGLYCYDLEGKLEWEKDLGDMQTRNSFGEGSSPALHGNTIVINWDHEGEDFIVALDKRTGKEMWRQSRDEPTTWSTPLIVQHGGKAQVVVSATNKVRSYDLATGEKIWECRGMTDNVIPTPVSDFGLVYAISGFRGASLLAIKLGHTGDLTDSAAIAWRHGKGTPYVPSPLLYDDRLYFYAGNNGTLSCFNAKTGQPLFETERIPDLLVGVYASPVGADGRIYLVGRDGKMVVIKHADKLELLATNKLDDRFDASPAVVGKELFLRGHKHLYCVAE